MPVTTILLLRHGHRLAWTLDPNTGTYTSSSSGYGQPFPTSLPADPPLASHGVRQAQETAAYLQESLGEVARDGRLRVYSSLFYRCLETLRPGVEMLMHAVATGERAAEHKAGGKSSSHVDVVGEDLLQIRGERGIGEWFGRAWFEQPRPAEATRMKKEFFPWVDDGYESLVVPDQHGEMIEELHDRVAMALNAIVVDVDAEFEQLGRSRDSVTLLLCGHAAQIIAAGRALTGQMPQDPNEEDFKCFTCGISKFSKRERSTRRNTTESNIGEAEEQLHEKDSNTAQLAEYDSKAWRTNGGVAGGWDCIMNSWCGHLSQGEERGWRFHGDESFDSYGLGQGKTAPPKTSDGGFHEEIVEDSNEDAGFSAKL